MKKNLVLLGMMAVGKSTLAKIVAEKLNLQFLLYGKSFPVDSGHEAKIERDKLNSWIIKKLKNNQVNTPL